MYGNLWGSWIGRHYKARLHRFANDERKSKRGLYDGGDLQEGDLLPRDLYNEDENFFADDLGVEVPKSLKNFDGEW